MYINASSSKGGGRNARETLTHSIRDCSTASSVFFSSFLSLRILLFPPTGAIVSLPSLIQRLFFFLLLLLPNSYFFLLGEELLIGPQLLSSAYFAPASSDVHLRVCMRT